MTPEKINRKCIVCGKDLEIMVDKDGTYHGGHYFGKLNLPVGKGKNKIVGESDIFGERKKVKLFEWTGKTEEIEYWECDNCFKN